MGAPPKVQKSDSEWRAELTPEQYRITRRHGTERAFTGPFQGTKGPGTYACVCCGAPLFRSEAKYESGTGWPSFFEPVAADAVAEHVDRVLFVKRTEVRCSACDAHLGHVFPDGLAPTGRRYCLNGTALTLDKDAA